MRLFKIYFIYYKYIHMNQYNAIINSDESFFEKKIIKSEENIIHMFVKQNFHKLLRNVEYYNPQIFMDQTFFTYKDSIAMLLNLCQSVVIQKTHIFKRAKCLKYKTKNSYIKGYNKN
jgi:hypothetical protein